MTAQDDIPAPAARLRDVHGGARRQRPGLPVVSSRALLHGGREVIIEHGEDQYRLRLTSSGKLILTK